MLTTRQLKEYIMPISDTDSLALATLAQDITSKLAVLDITITTEIDDHIIYISFVVLGDTVTILYDDLEALLYAPITARVRLDQDTTTEASAIAQDIIVYLSRCVSARYYRLYKNISQ